MNLIESKKVKVGGALKDIILTSKDLESDPDFDELIDFYIRVFPYAFAESGSSGKDAFVYSIAFYDRK